MLLGAKFRVKGVGNDLLLHRVSLGLDQDLEKPLWVGNEPRCRGRAGVA